MDYLRYYLANIIVLVGIVGFLLGGSWVWLGIATYIPLLICDLLAKPDLKVRDVTIPRLVEIPLYLHVVLMVLLYAAFFNWLTTLENANSVPLHVLFGAVISLGWFGAVPNLPVNHELMHRRNKIDRLLADFLGTFYADPSRDVAHLHTHHIHLGTQQDSDTAYRGETMYSFALRATIGSLKDFFKIEKERCKKKGLSLLSPRGRIFRASVQLFILFGLAAWFGGLLGIILTIGSVLVAKTLVEMFNYYQHYGLIRVEGEQYESKHLWNHLTPVTRAVSFEITNHNDHHMDSYLPFYNLKPKIDGPQMPSILLCYLAGLIPPIWFNFIAKPKLKEWDIKFATKDEQQLAREANKKAGWEDWLDEVETA